MKLIFDIGTNSIKCFLFSAKNKKWKIIKKEKYEARLGDFINPENNLSNDGIKKCSDIINSTISKLENKNIETTAFGTEVFRTIKNATEVLDIVEEQTGVKIKILSKEEELEIFWKGLISDFDYEGVVAAIDIGGGSVQFMYGDKNGLMGCHYLKTGALFLRNQHIKSEPPTVEEYNKIEEVIKEAIKDISIKFPPNTPFIHGSTSVIDFYEEANIPMQKYNKSPSHPYEVDLSITKDFYLKLRTLPRQEREKFFPSHPAFTEGASIGIANVLLIAEKTGLTTELPSNNNILNGFLY